MKYNKVYLLINLYLSYQKIWIYITINGLISWLITKLCWKHYITFLCPYDNIFDSITHILFGIWIFIGLYIVFFQLLLWIRKFQIRNFKLLITLIIVILLVSLFIDSTNEFTNNKLGKYSQKAYKHDLKNTYFDLIGTSIIVLLSLTRSVIIYRKKKSISYNNY